MRIGIEHLKSRARVDDGTLTARLHAKNLQPQQRVNINPRGIIRSRDNHRALCLDLFVAVIADLVRQGLPGLQPRKKIDALGVLLCFANDCREEREQTPNGDKMSRSRSTSEIANAIQQS